MVDDEADSVAQTEPAVDGRDRSAIRNDAAARAPFYTGDDWNPEAGGLGTALLEQFADLAADVVERLDHVPEKHRAAFVDTLGFDRLAPQAATLPLTVEISDGAGGTIHLPSGTRALAPATETRPELTFELTEGFEATPASFDRLVSVDPRIDHVGTHADTIGGGDTATFFGGTNAQHRDLYLGHPELLTLDGRTTVQVRVLSTADAATLAALNWEYFGENPPDPDADEGWKPIEPLAEPLPPDPDFDRSMVEAILDDHGFELTTDDDAVIERWLVSTLLERERDDPAPPYVDPARQPDAVALYDELDEYVQSLYEDYPPETSSSFSLVTLQFSIPDPFVATEIEETESNWIRARVPPESGPGLAKRFEAIAFRNVVLAAGRLRAGTGGTGGSIEGGGTGGGFGGATIVGGDLDTESGGSGGVFGDATIVGGDFPTVVESFSPERILTRIIGGGLEGGGLPLSGFEPDDLLENDVPQKVPNETDDVVRPFGTLPREQDSFYVGSTEAFTKTDGTVTLSYAQDDAITFGGIEEPRPEVSWEYWNGSAWEYLDVTVESGGNSADSFIPEVGAISFIVPDDLEPTTTSGHEGHWIRARLFGGSYGQIRDDIVDSVEGIWRRMDSVRPPELTAITVQYETGPESGSGGTGNNNGSGGDSDGTGNGDDGGTGADGPPDDAPFTDVPTGLIPGSPEQCFTDNNLAVTTVDPTGQFRPFEPLAEDKQTLYLGFDGTLQDGPLQVFADFADFEYPDTFRPRARWEVYTDSGWVLLSLRDDTDGLTERGVVRFTPPEATTPLETFGDSRHWLRVRLTAHQFVASPYRRRLDTDEGTGDGERCGDYLPTTPPGSEAAMALPTTGLVAHNTEMAANVRSIDDEILGSSDGTPDQEFTVASPPVRDQTLWVDERTILSAGERTALREDPDVTVEVVGDEADPSAVWVQWTEVENFLGSGPSDRHYTLDAVAGTVTCGDGTQGDIPPRGRDNVRLSYETGGGEAGNVPAGAVEELEGSLAFVDSATNLLMSDGAADAESSAAVMERAPRAIRDRNRAVAPVDFERIANASARKLARARCLPGLDPRGQYRPGWVTVLIVPRSGARKPVPSASLREQVTAGLSAHAPASLLGDLGEERLVVRGPSYVEVTVEATVVAGPTESISALERAAADALSAFLHPLTGGDDGEGWSFGDLPCVSDCFGVLEAVADVDHVEDLSLYFESEDASRTIRPGQDGPDVDPDVLVYSGIHDLAVVGGV